VTAMWFFVSLPNIHDKPGVKLLLDYKILLYITEVAHLIDIFLLLSEIKKPKFSLALKLI
jgi:hypothetical protein